MNVYTNRCNKNKLLKINNHTNTFIIYRMQINIFKAIYIIYNFNIL